MAYVGFGAQDHTLFDDAATVWWSRSAQAPDLPSRSGSFCYFGGGERHALGSWPSTPPTLFVDGCDSGAVSA